MVLGGSVASALVKNFNFCKQACKYAAVDKLAIRVIESNKGKSVITGSFRGLGSCRAITVSKNNGSAFSA